VKTEVRHYERWSVTVHREEGDSWPDAILIESMAVRQMRPETINFGLALGRAEPDTVMVFGPKIGGDSIPAVSRYHHSRLPEWVDEIIEHERQAHGLGPGRTAPSVD
jgi:hypothetical protein